jgi:peptidoglycan-N-acetylglucosamine deacetylase
MRKLYHSLQRILLFYIQFFTRDIRYINNSFSKQLALTFDDGPDPVLTGQILDFLLEHRIQATFFISGPAAERAPEIAERISREGHLAGNHGYEHISAEVISSEEMISGFEKTNQIIKDVTGIPVVRFYRPPYGKVTKAYNFWIRRKSAYNILWSLDSFDYKSEFSPDKLAEMLLGDVKNGDIILFHDNKPYTLQLLMKILPELQKREYHFLKLDERFR